MTGTEIIWACRALFMKVCYNIRQPVKVGFHTVNTFGMLEHKPVSVAVCPIMIGSARWPRLLKLAGVEVINIRKAS